MISNDKMKNKDTFIEMLKIWYDDIENVTFVKSDNGVYVRFMIGYRYVCNFEHY